MEQNTEEKKEEKTSAPASEQEKQEEEKNPETAESGEGKEEKTSESSASDDKKNKQGEDSIYKSELQRLQKQLNQAEHTIEETKKENKRLKSGQSEEQEEDDASEEPEEIDRKKLSEEIKAEVKADILKDTILENLTDDEDKRAVIEFHYKNTIKHSGYTKEAIKADLEAAQILADRHKILKENEELKISLKNRQGISKGNEGTNQDKKEVVITDEDRRIADRHFNGDINRYLKYKQKKNN